MRGELDGAKGQLAKAQAELESIAHKTESWQMAAPGAKATSENSPVSYKLRQDIRQYREDVGRTLFEAQAQEAVELLPIHSLPHPPRISRPY